MTDNSADAAPAAGRPRDPEVDRRVLRAAAEVFGEEGWGKFTVDAVARRANVGKASIYLRWPNKKELLADCLEARVTPVADIDTGSVREDLIQLAGQMLTSFFGASGRATTRLLMDADRIPGVAERVKELRQSQVLAARAIVRRGIARGELKPGTSVTLLLDAVVGGCLNHALATPDELRGRVGDGLTDYAVELVDFVLGAVTAG